MKNITLILAATLISLNCYSQKHLSKKEKGVGIAKKTENPNTPYIYKNGFLNYTITKIPLDKNDETKNPNELKFNATFSSMYSKKVMFDKFGKWTKEVRPNNERHPILIWDNVKLFDDNDQLFKVYADGSENRNEIYSSVLVFDLDGKDCLSENSIYKEKLIAYFSDGIQKLKDDRKFFDLYWDSLNKFDSKK